MDFTDSESHLGSHGVDKKHARVSSSLTAHANRATGQRSRRIHHVNGVSLQKTFKSENILPWHKRICAMLNPENVWKLLGVCSLEAVEVGH
jgi:hypothetical protein